MNRLEQTRARRRKLWKILTESRGGAFPTNRQLCEMLPSSHATVVTDLRALEEMGYIARMKRADGFSIKCAVTVLIPFIEVTTTMQFWENPPCLNRPSSNGD